MAWKGSQTRKKSHTQWYQRLPIHQKKKFPSCTANKRKEQQPLGQQFTPLQHTSLSDKLS